MAKSLIDKGDLGIVGFDFSKHIPDVFVVALEGGLIARCSVLGTTSIKGCCLLNIVVSYKKCELFSGNSHEVPFYDPVFKYYEPHKGEIVSIRFLVHRKDMFLTSGTDGEIRVYLLDQVSCSFIILQL